MMNEKEVSERLTRAVMADADENPTLMNELVARGEQAVTNALNLDILTALRGDPGQVLFPHLRGTLKDIIGLAKSEKWAQTGKYLGEEGSFWTDFGSILKPLALLGGTIFTAITAKDIANTNAAALKAQQDAAARAAASGQQTLAYQQQGGFSTASMFGGGMGTFLLLGVAGAVIYVISTQIGKKSGRRR